MSCEDCVYYSTYGRVCTKKSDGGLSSPCRYFDDVHKEYKEKDQTTAETFRRSQGVYDDKEVCDFCGRKKHTWQICEVVKICPIWDICLACLSGYFERV